MGISKGVVIFVLSISSSFAQQIDWNTPRFSSFSPISEFKLPKITVLKSGPYVGIQRGRFNVLEFGMEAQYKKVKLVKPITHAAHMGFNYNFRYNILGYDVGYWFKMGRLDLTYGLNFVFRSDFTSHRAGIAPVLGFKFWQLHLQTGVHILSRTDAPFETNTLFISLRYVFINNRNVQLKKKRGS